VTHLARPFAVEFDDRVLDGEPYLLNLPSELA